jgi:DNA invertase Pin-like site-specific DNA recombinase
MDFVKKFVAYYRVSTEKQDLSTQKRILRNHIQEDWIDCEFEEIVSGKSMNVNQQLREAVSYCKENNKILAVARLDRLGRNLSHAAKINEELDGWIYTPGFVAPGERINIMVFGVLMAAAQVEREWISERTKEGLETARKRGVKFGPKKPITKAQHVLKGQKRREYIEIEKVTDPKFQNVRNFIVKRITEWEEKTGRKATKYFSRKYDKSYGDIHLEVSDELNSLQVPMPDYYARSNSKNKFTPQYVAKIFREAKKDVEIKDYIN